MSERLPNCGIGIGVAMAFQQDKENGNLQRRSSWTCDSVTISYASRKGTNRCRRCKGFLAEGELRFGVSDDEYYSNIRSTYQRACTESLLYCPRACEWPRPLRMYARFFFAYSQAPRVAQTLAIRGIFMLFYSELHHIGTKNRIRTFLTDAARFITIINI